MSDHQRSSMGTTPLCGTCDNTYYPCPTRILLDLIADLRERHRPTPSGYLCEDCQEDYLWPCPEARAADRAEARLREVTGDE